MPNAHKRWNPWQQQSVIIGARESYNFTCFRDISETAQEARVQGNVESTDGLGTDY